MKKVLGLVVLVVGALFLWTQLGGNVTADQPTEKPALPDVDVNKGADAARKASDTAANEVSSWTPDTWRIIVGLVIASVIVISWAKYPAFKWMVIGGGLMVLVVMVFV
jgi:Na+/H+ antiporter NhaC